MRCDSPPRPVSMLLAISLLAVGCSSGGEAVASDSTAPAPETVTSTTAATATTSTTAPTTTAAATTASTTAETETTMALDNNNDNNTDNDGCRRLTGFGSEDERQRWQVVNDDVMGGRSLGDVSFEDDRLIFDGEINTDGGGFASIRLPLEPEVLVGHDRVVFRAKPDARSYMVTFDDDAPARDRRVSHRAEIGFDSPGQWQTVSVAFEDLFPAIFGRPIDDLPLRTELASRMGLMISDGIDGRFRLEVDWIDLCPG